ncbi:MAG: Rpp14/Pop5 family protein [Candidatus Methanomethylicia archaeon]|nr:Rpp14/Pop5 family protein [Candidatus Methanomethylicia archaeon]MCX8169042.1 Rpp14/Pop5 family protein [Candidatus Methanomethylicia archaeon]MDW7988774.1 Rpp14/Pop5 family protein [Nitrososphaerota archaeon]
MINMKLRKNRYLIFRVICKEDNPNITFKDILNSILNSILTLFGIAGSSKMYISLMRYYPEKKIGILRCDHLNVTKARAALVFINNINGYNVILSIAKVTGTLRKAEKIINSSSTTKLWE